MIFCSLFQGFFIACLFCFMNGEVTSIYILYLICIIITLVVYTTIQIVKEDVVAKDRSFQLRKKIQFNDVDKKG